MAHSTAGAPDTIVCSSCWTVLPADNHFCSACGSQVSSGVTGAQRLSALLSEANLFRMRARWLDAENRCIEALRLDPSNVDGHSLLGDIYRDQGKREDAAQWYQLALDLNPDSVADKAKLAELDKQRHRKPVPDPGVIKASVPLSPSQGTQRLFGLPPSAWLQAITAVAVVFVVVVIGIAITMRKGGTVPSTGTAPGSPTVRGPAIPLPSQTDPGAPNGLTSRQPAQTPPPVIPGQSAPLIGNPLVEDIAPAPPDSSAQSPPERTTVVRTIPPGSTDYERKLRDFVSQEARLGGGAALGVVTVDPRHPRAAIVVCIAPQRTDSSAVRLNAIKTAVKVAVAGLAGDSLLSTITVNVRLRVGGDRYIPVFAGDAERMAVRSLSAEAAFEQMLAAFSSYWWAPAYAPPGLPPASNPPPQ